MTESVSDSSLRRCFEPAINAQTHTLILGSFPSRASLAFGQYYAHQRNHFWPIMSALFDCVAKAQTYDDRLSALLFCGVGIWDVFSSCCRKGSLDADIIEAEFNDFSLIREIAPDVTVILFNGKTAAKAQKKLSGLGYRTIVLPSTSPAYTISFDRKLSAWREGIAARCL